MHIYPIWGLTSRKYASIVQLMKQEFTTQDDVIMDDFDQKMHRALIPLAIGLCILGLLTLIAA